MALSNNMGMGVGRGISAGLNTFMAQLPGILQQYNKEARTKKGQSILDEFDVNNPLQQQSATADLAGKATVNAPILGEDRETMHSDLMQGGASQQEADEALKGQFPQGRQKTATGDLAGTGGQSQAAPTKPRKQSDAMKNTGRFKSDVDRLSKQYGVDSSEVNIVMGVESGGGASLTSDTNVWGEMQVTGKTAGDYGFTREDMRDSTKSISAGTQHLAAIKKRHPDWTPEQRWAAYNIGEGAVSKAIKTKGMGWEANLLMEASPAKKKELESGLRRYRNYANEVGYGSGTASGDGAEQQAASTTKRESMLTNVESTKTASETLDALLNDIKAEKPIAGKGRAQKKLEYFYEHASPDVVKAMEPVIKKIENLSAGEAKAYEQKLKIWNVESDQKVRVAIAKAQLEGNAVHKEALLRAKTDRDKLSAKISGLRAESTTIRDQIDNYDKILKDASTSKNKGAFKRQHPDIFTENVTDQGEIGIFDLIPWDKKEWVTNTIMKTKMQEKLDSINAKIEDLVGGLGTGGYGGSEGALPTTGGKSSSGDYSHLFSPVKK
jgi:hypothetical protein